MIKSMTGYGRCKSSAGGKMLTFEIRSVNNRFADISARLPRAYAPIESKIKELCGKYVTRGKIDVFLTVESIDGDPVSISLNREFVSGYIELLERIKSEYGIPGEITLSMLASKPDIMIQSRADEDTDELWSRLKPVCVSALEQYDAMRAAEGERLRTDMLKHIDCIEKLRADIAVTAPETVKRNYEKIRARVTELLDGVPVDESRLLTECAAYADRTDVTEELVRLESHCTEFRATLDSDGPVGKKLEYLIPEMLRETNTLGSKCNDYGISKMVVTIKTEIEKLREQTANIE